MYHMCVWSSMTLALNLIPMRERETVAVLCCFICGKRWTFIAVCVCVCFFFLLIELQHENYWLFSILCIFRCIFLYSSFFFLKLTLHWLSCLVGDFLSFLLSRCPMYLSHLFNATDDFIRSIRAEMANMPSSRIKRANIKTYVLIPNMVIDFKNKNTHTEIEKKSVLFFICVVARKHEQTILSFRFYSFIFN